jgi:hypothetical protein
MHINMRYIIQWQVICLQHCLQCDAADSGAAARFLARTKQAAVRSSTSLRAAKGSMKAAK